MNAILTRPLSDIRLPAWLVAVAPLLPALVVVFTLWNMAPALSPDSLAYLAGADELRTTGTLSAKFQFWPPLYPMLLSLSPDPLTFAAILGSVFALLALLGAWVVFRGVMVSRLALTLSLLVLVSITRYGTIFGSVWSEALYIPLTAWLAYFWGRYLQGVGGLFPACLLLALAMLTRHVGVVLAIAMGMTALYVPGRVKALAAIAAACVPWVLWCARTYALSGTIAGPRPPAANPDVLHQLALFGRTWEHWLFPHAYFSTGGVIAGALVLATLVAVLPIIRRERLLTFAALWAFGHCVLTIYSASRTTLDVDARTLFPVFWPMLLVAAWLACKIESKAAKVALALYGLFWFAAPNAIINWLTA